MTLEQLLTEFRRRGIVYVADRVGAMHFDSPFGFPGDLIPAIARHREALVLRRCLPARVAVAPTGRAC